MADVPLQVVSDNSSSERRITPSWTISQLKSKLEFVTGIPPSSQRLSLKTNSQEVIPIDAADEDAVHLSSFPLIAYTELRVSFRSYQWLLQRLRRAPSGHITNNPPQPSSHRTAQAAPFPPPAPPVYA